MHAITVKFVRCGHRLIPESLKDDGQAASYPDGVFVTPCPGGTLFTSEKVSVLWALAAKASITANGCEDQITLCPAILAYHGDPVHPDGSLHG